MHELTLLFSVGSLLSFTNPEFSFLCMWQSCERKSCGCEGGGRECCSRRCKLLEYHYVVFTLIICYLVFCPMSIFFLWIITIWFLLHSLPQGEGKNLCCGAWWLLMIRIKHAVFIYFHWFVMPWRLLHAICTYFHILCLCICSLSTFTVSCYICMHLN